MSSRSVFLEVDLHIEVVIIVSVVVVEALEYQDGALSVVREHLDLEQISRRVAAVCAFYSSYAKKRQPSSEVAMNWR